MTVFLFVVEIAIVIIQILCRNIIGRSFATLEELAIILLPYFGFFAATVTLYNGNHVQIDFFYNKLPESVRRVLFVLTQIAIFAAIVILSYYSTRLGIRQWKIKTPANGWPNGWRYLCLPVVAPFMLVLLGHNIYRGIFGKFDDFQGLHPVVPKDSGEEAIETKEEGAE